MAVRPDYAEALCNHGGTLHGLRQYDEALVSYEQALAARPDYAEALGNRGKALHELGRFGDALWSYESALTVRPDHANTLYNRGVTLYELRRYDEALTNFERSIVLEPNHRSALSAMAGCATRLCKWTLHDEISADIRNHASAKKLKINPFVLLDYSDDKSLQLSCARRHVQEQVIIPPKPIWQHSPSRSDRIKIAYVSADFGRHPTAYLMAELIELHDRSRFEIIGVSFGLDDGSAIRARLVAGFDQFIDVRTKSDEEVARVLNHRQVDIAVDLMGHTRNSRLQIFAFRPAPIQVSYLGFVSTMGAEFIDYIIADPIVLPLDQQPYYTEKIVHLPDCYQVNDRKRQIAMQAQSRQDVGLPVDGFVFCCFNGNWKITSSVFSIWVRLLEMKERSVLWLLGDNKGAVNNLRREATARGIDATRLIFTKRLPFEAYLASYRLADLFFDTLPYNAGATASDALWSGLPVLTCKGSTFPGRMASSLLHAIGLPDLVTSSLAEYEALALKIAHEPALLAEIKARLARNREIYPLFDTDNFRRNIETAYVAMWETWQRAEKPRQILVTQEHRLK